MVVDYLGSLCEVFFLSFKKILKPGQQIINLKQSFEPITANLIKGVIQFLDNSGQENIKAFSLLRLCMSLVNPEFCQAARKEYNERYNILKRMYMPKNTVESKAKIPTLTEEF